MSGWQVPQVFEFEGREVRWGALGPEGAPAVVLLHGTPFSSYEWHRVAPWLAAGYRVQFHDMLGYGRSSMAEGDVSLGIQDRVLAALLEHWRLDRPHVVAHDFGGATALRAHLSRGCEYRTLTLIDAVAIRPWGSPFVQHVRAHEAAFAGMPAYMHAALLPAYFLTTMHREIGDRELGVYLEPWIGEEGQRAFYRQIAQMDLRYTDEIEDRLGQIRCPVQVLWGEEDGWIPIERGRELARRLGDAPFTAVPGSGHLM